MTRILISGYYGYDNLGDEAVLETILNNINNAIEQTEITVLSSNPSMTMGKHDVKSVERSSLGSVLKAIKDCDILISGGGSLLQDVTSRLSIFYYLFIILVGCVLRKKVMVYSQGIGPIRRPFNRWVTKLVLNKVHAITVRESYSKSDLIDMGINEKLIEVTADPVVSMDTSKAVEGVRLLQAYKPMIDIKKPKIGFALRGKDYTAEFESKILKTINLLKENLDATIVFIPFYYDEDIKTIMELRKKLEGDEVYLDKSHNAKEILSITKELDVLVGERLHSLIFAAICNVPMIALSYDPKIEYFMETIGLRAEYSIDSFVPETLSNRIYETYITKDSIKENLLINIIELQLMLKKNEHILSRLL